MIFYAIALVVAAMGFANFKWGLYVYLLFRVFLVTNVTILSIPGIPLLTVDMALAIFYLALFLAQGQKGRCSRASFPWKPPMVAMVAVWAAASLFSVAGIAAELSAFAKSFMMDVLAIWMMWETLEDADDFRRLFLGLTVCFLASAVYGLYEGATHENPLAAYEATMNSDAARVVTWEYSESGLRGYRVKSVFEHAIGAGLNWAMYIVAVVYLLQKKKLPTKWLSLLTATLCAICLVLCNSRAPYLFIIVALLFLFRGDVGRGVAALGIAAIAVVVLIVVSGKYSANLLSMFDSGLQGQVGGSSASMRFEQFDAALSLMLQEPVFGLGSKFQNVLPTAETSALLGSESVWLRVLPSYGLFGASAYLFLAIWSIVVLPARYRVPDMAFFALAYWLTYSLTSVPGMLTYLYYLGMIALLKNSGVYEGEAARASAETNGMVVSASDLHKRRGRGATC